MSAVWNRGGERQRKSNENQVFLRGIYGENYRQSFLTLIKELEKNAAYREDA